MAVSSNDFGLLSPVHTTTNASVLVKTGIGRLRGILVTASKLGGSLELLDSLTNAPPILVREFDTDTTVPKYYEFGDAAFGTGLYVVVKGVLFCTIYYF
jgi:hypothetical protein